MKTLAALSSASTKLSNVHAVAAIVRLYGFDQHFLAKVDKLTREIDSLCKQVTIEFRSSSSELRFVRIFANDEGIYSAPNLKWMVSIEKISFDELILMLNMNYFRRKARA